jgi:hypothetical protein
MDEGDRIVYVDRVDHRSDVYRLLSTDTHLRSNGFA